MDINYNELTLEQLKEINRKSAAAVADFKSRRKKDGILRVPRDDGQPFHAIVGGHGRQSEATVTLVSLRGSRDANRTTVDAPDTRCSTVEVCEGA